ncbi:DinB family protein [Deinococcus frigens]|uniref:DinB family protein n=1 Tax=Deinococcus frigens TaxID=249403 RepID=UPI000AF2E27F|nr:DinB family protein [Deinococcus frigens]
MSGQTFGKAVGNLFPGGPANVSWEAALADLEAGDAERTPNNLPHSAAQIVAHVQFWQAHLLDTLAGKHPATPEHSAGGWPAPGDWQTLRTTFLRDAGKLRAHARDPELCAALDRSGVPHAATLTNSAGHSVYHLGQVVTIRQALGLWPPPGGGDTW